jgi:tripartite-type tricarboxylate transporter receptor subunit TctC
MKKFTIWLALATSFCLGAQAQTYPTKPIRLIVPFAPGGGNHTVARAIAQQLTLAACRT